MENTDKLSSIERQIKEGNINSLQKLDNELKRYVSDEKRAELKCLMIRPDILEDGLSDEENQKCIDYEKLCKTLEGDEEKIDCFLIQTKVPIKFRDQNVLRSMPERQKKILRTIVYSGDFVDQYNDFPDLEIVDLGENFMGDISLYFNPNKKITFLTKGALKGEEAVDFLKDNQFVISGGSLSEVEAEDYDQTYNRYEPSSVFVRNEKELKIAESYFKPKEIAIDFADCDYDKLRAFPELRSLYSGAGNSITAEQIQQIAGLESLRHLHFMEELITDDDLDVLKNLRNLKKLELEDCEGMTRQGINKFKIALPKCEVILINPNFEG